LLQGPWWKTTTRLVEKGGDTKKNNKREERIVTVIKNDKSTVKVKWTGKIPLIEQDQSEVDGTAYSKWRLVRAKYRP
jgi:hypothetical protein